jgi:hypothetical protein
MAIRGLAHGLSTECEFIKDPDRRNYCRAISEKAESWCGFIKDADLRHLCRVEVKVRK